LRDNVGIYGVRGGCMNGGYPVGFFLGHFFRYCRYLLVTCLKAYKI
jgi:hypothetical protein